MVPHEETNPLATLSIPQPKTDAELLGVLERYLGIRLASKAVCKGHCAPAQAFCDAYFARHPWMVWKAARGVGGKSYMLAALGWMESVTLRSSVTILGGSGDQSQRVHEYMRQFWMKPNVPYEALVGDPSQKRTRLVWGNIIEAQLASQRSVRGAHPPRLRIDEADEVDWRLVDAARGQAMDKAGVLSNVVFSSTHQNADGTMTRLLREASEKGMPVYEWCWRESMEPHGWLSEAAKQRYRSTVSESLWRVEVELGEPSPEGRAIVPEMVEAMFSLAYEAGARAAAEEIQEPEGRYFEFEPPTASGQYANGCDWAKELHHTVIWTWRTDVTPMRLVAYERLNRRPWPFMIERFMERIRRYPGESFHDALGVGAEARDYFTEDVRDFEMIGKKRNDLFLDYISAIERGELRAPRILNAYHAHKYVRNKDLFTVPSQAHAPGQQGKGHPPDAFVAGAISYQAALAIRNPLTLVGSSTGATPVQTDTRTGGPSPLSQATAFLQRKKA